jgi:putative ABC transport system permease protein
MPGAVEPEVLRRLDHLIEPYGGLGSFGREDQFSHRLISDEMKQLRGMSIIPPSIFLSIAAFIIHVVLSRLINTQREQIATLKAFGYSRFEIGLHYLKFALAITTGGSMLGTGVGIWLGQGLTELYARYFRFPAFSYHLDPLAICLALLMGGAAAGLGILSAVHRAVRLAPAEAMRPEPPARYTPTVLERLGLQRFFSPPLRMILRQLERRPLRALLSCMGIALSITVLIIGNFFNDAAYFLIDFQFQISQRQDMTLTLVEPRSRRALHEIRHLPGIRQAEPFRSVPVRVRFGHRSKRTAILGLSSHRELFRLVDSSEQLVDLPDTGVVLSEKLAEVLGIRPGESLAVEVMEGIRPVRSVRVSGLIRDFSGLSVYMSLSALNRLMREGDTLSGAYVTIDPSHIDRLYQALKNTPALAGSSLKHAALQNFRKLLAENLLLMQSFYLVFACIIAVGVVYNSVHVTLSERTRELATLRVIGFTCGEVSMILLGEIAILTGAAIPLGLGLGHGLAALTVWAVETESQRFPLVIDVSTYVFAATVVVVAVLLSGLAARRKIDRLNLVSVLKSQD